MARHKASKDGVNQLQFSDFLETYRNQGLFADHFLKDRLPQLREWKDVEGLDEAFAATLKLYDEQASRFTTRTNEPQTEHDFIQPVLNLLWREQNEGDCYQVQVSIPNLDARRQPDYAFFHTAEERNGAEERQGTIDYWRNAPALGDAKRWTASLDKERGADENPSAQICNYLYRSRVRWGILTNGRIWRLYEREKSSSGGVFYEVDLEDTLSNHNTEAFKYFYLFFRREAFVPDETGVTFVERVFQGSVDYATEVGDRLKESVYDALRALMNGFFDHPNNELHRHDPDTLKLAHENCLIVLYRLLFLFYAEDRLLLPRSDEPYASYSLSRLQQEINKHLRSGETYLSTVHRFWSELTGLFELIDRGSSEAGIPAYNGGLFSPSNHPHVAHTPQPNAKRWEIGDHYLARAINLLAYERDSWDEIGERHVDYATLDVQHLGSIYEGLLELHPSIAEEPLIETLKSGKSLFKPENEVSNPRPIHGQPPRRISEKEIYLATDRGERKATGSYYTPKYIVQYIVENTVGPLADEAAEKVAAMRPEVDKEIRKLKREIREWEKSSTRDAENHVAALNRGIEEQKRRLLEPYLSLKILDPAMGSGHFLVGAADFLSLAMATDPKIEIDDEDPQAFCKRLIVERCLYGVDLNPLAVELAKLSLWLHTVSKDKALSFLDHHLRCGNSLIGARIEDDLSQTPPELNARGRVKKVDTTQPILGFTEALIAKHLQHFLDTFRKIMETPTGDAETERMKDKWYRDMDSVRDRFRSVANCWLTPYFGVPVTLSQCQRAIKALRGSDAEWQVLQEEKWFRDIQSSAHQRCFFHWELEFPEAFFDPHGFKLDEGRGFDAVIGNPPYGLITDAGTKLLVQQTFASTQYQPDNYVAFMERTHRLTRQQGYESLIVPTTFLAMHYFSAIRRFLLDHCCILTLIHFRFPVFEDPTVESSVYICQSELGHEKRRENNVSGIVIGELGNFIAKRFEAQAITQERFEEIPENDFNISLGTEEASIVEKMLRADIEPLGNLCDMTVGIKPYQTGKGKPKQTREMVKKRTFDATYRRDSTYHQYLMGRDINRYVVAPLEERWISYGEWLAEPRPKAPFFESKRIIVRQTGDSIIATLENKQRLTLNNIHNLRLRLQLPTYEFLLAILNSRLITYFHQQVVPEANRVFAEVKIVDLERLPIRRISFITPADKHASLSEDGKRLYLSQENSDSVSDFAEQQLAQIPERAGVVHDLLAFLAEQMIEMNKQKQMETKGFLGWFERYIGAEVDGLTNKTKLRAYHEYDFETILGVLRQNRRKLAVNTDAREVQEAIEAELGKSMAKLNPLKEKISATDRLIDLIVYQLYGLTEEEIAIVEGAIV